MNKNIAINSPEIFLGLSIGLGLGTLVSSIDATVKACKKIDEIKLQEQKSILTKKEIFKSVWKYYIIPTILGIGSAACSISSFEESHKQIQSAALAGALAESTCSALENAIEKTYGKEGLETVKKEKFNEEVRRDISSDPRIIGSNFIVKESISGQKIFLNPRNADGSLMHTSESLFWIKNRINEAENTLNSALINGEDITVDMWLDILNDVFPTSETNRFDHMKVGNEQWWSMDETNVVKVSCHQDIVDCIPYTIIEYTRMPVFLARYV